MTVNIFSGSIFHKPHPHETVMCLPAVKESVDTMLFIAKGCWISHQSKGPKYLLLIKNPWESIWCFAVMFRENFLRQIHLWVQSECGWSDCAEVFLYQLECTGCRVWTVLLFYCIKMTFSVYSSWRIWNKCVF